LPVAGSSQPAAKDPTNDPSAPKPLINAIARRLRRHDLRHEAVSRLFENTDLRDNEIMAISGHLSTEMLKRYSHLRWHRLASRLGLVLPRER
jgi:integrase